MRQLTTLAHGGLNSRVLNLTASNSAPALRRPLRVGYLPLTDAAPFIVANDLGIFGRHNVDVDLRREIGWATIREKIIFGELDAAQAPAPMLWSTQLGIGCRSTEVLSAFVVNLHGNALTLSCRLREAGVRDATSLGEYVRDRAHHSPLTFGAVFSFSSHHLFLRQWLQSGGIDLERDVRIVIVPPAQMFRNLAAGTLDGFCAGEPWNSVAVNARAGWCPTWSAAQLPGHVEKVLMVTRRFAESRYSEHARLVRALAEAAAWCDEPRNREGLAEILSAPRFLNLRREAILPALTGRFDCGLGRVETVPDFHVFHAGGANVPAPAKAVALQSALGAAHLLSVSQAADTALPHTLFRSDLYREILQPHESHTHPASSAPVR